jgi:hypothetical protein
MRCFNQPTDHGLSLNRLFPGGIVYSGDVQATEHALNPENTIQCPIMKLEFGNETGI